MRRVIVVSVCLLLLAAAWLFWPRGGAAPAPVKSPAASAAVVASVAPAATNAAPAPAAAVVTRSAASTNRVAFRLANTTRTLGELTASPRAILLENALVDTSAKLELNIPKHLRATTAPGAFIVQARGPVTAAFRAVLASAGAQIVSYIPNNAYLVQLSGAGAGGLAGDPLVQAVLPYEPYFKVQSSLLSRAVEQKPLPDGQVLTLGLFANGASATVAQIEKLGGTILATDRSPFGPVVRVQPQPGSDWLALAQLPGVQRVEPATRRQLANDLARVTMALTTDYYATNENWLGLSGSNVVVEVNDTGVDANHRDFSETGTALAPGTVPPSRVNGWETNSTIDNDGHGTHVGGIIAGNGSMSLTLANTPSGSVTNADMRGKAPAAKLFAVGFLGANDTNIAYSDRMLQEIPALTNALISNNSWINAGDNEYDLSAAGFDAAVRDALPGTTGPQPVLFVFAAGNDGGGEPSGIGGAADSILSPATAKNVVTVGALEQYRNITNEVVALDGTTNAIWADGTDSSSQVAAYSARGNVGVQTEGTYGRFKPDVVAPGTFVVSTRSTTWDKAAYYNPTNYHDEYSQSGLIVTSNQLAYGGGAVPINGVGLTIMVEPNRLSPVPFPTNFPIYLALNGLAGPTNFDVATSNNVLSVPPGGGTLTTIGPLLNAGFSCAVGDPTNFPINFDLFIQIATTNDDGNRLMVLSNLNETIGPWYYYESGTSMAAPAVSGTLALLQDFFVNQRNPAFTTNPSPALLKAMLINGARLTPGYNNFAITNNINYEGWGLVQVPNSVPLGLTNTAAGTNGLPMFVLDQSPTNALATGDSRTFKVTVPSLQARAQDLRFTLAWTDPPGNPAAGIKLVNNLDLIVTNLDDGRVYYGNTFGAGTLSIVVNSNTTPDSINNVENIWIASPTGTNYAVTVLGRNVAVNAVTAEQTNVVQDFALVISSGTSVNTNGITVTPVAPTPTTAVMPQVTYVQSYTNGIYFNQLAGANAPWLSTNDITIGSGFGTNASLFVGQTNQWHFYVVTNTTTFTNAAFIIFLPQTQADPRMGVFTYSAANATRPEADLNLFVSSTPDVNAGLLTNLDLTVISNCVFNVNGDQSSLARGGTKFIVYSNSTPGQVYNIGVQCEDQMGGEYGFLAFFSENPFSQMQNGKQVVNGFPLPQPIPDGSPAHGGVGYVFGLAIYPMDVNSVTVTNTITHQDYGDLIGVLNHNNTSVVLNNHDGGIGNVTNYTTVYNDDGLAGTVHVDGPGTLRSYKGKEAAGPWLMTQVDDALNQTGSITGFSMSIEPHVDLTHGLQTVFVPAGGWWYGYVDVPVGYTNMLVVATNITSPPLGPVQMYLNFDVEPDFTNYLVRADLTNGVPPGNEISYGPPLQPGRYFVGLFNPSAFTQEILIGVTLAFNASAINELNFEPGGPMPLLDDAVTNSYLFVTNTDTIQDISVGLRVDHERISDLVFHLISPDGTRYLLMENRGGQSTNGCGATVITTNIVNVTANGNAQPNTNVINVGMTSGTFPITYNFYTAPDQMTVYYGNGVNPANLIYDTGMTNNPPGPGYNPVTAPQNTLPVTINVSFPPPGVPANLTNLTIVINQFGNTNGTAWTYTAGGVITNTYYLAFTEDTNLTTTPIKYAVPPFVPLMVTNYVVVTNITATNAAGTNFSTFDTATAGSYLAGSSVDGWSVDSNQVSVVNDAANASGGSQFLALANGSISYTLPTVVGFSNVLTFAYRGPGAVGFWRGENNNANDSVGANNGTLTQVGFSAGQVGSAFEFAGGQSSNVVDLADPVDLRFTNSFSIDAWIFVKGLPTGANYNQANIFFRGDTRSFLDPYAFAVMNTGGLRFHIENAVGNIVNLDTAPIPMNQWEHVAAVFDGVSGLMQVYANGVLIGSTTTAIRPFQNLNPAFSPGVAIGNCESGSGTAPESFNGTIDELTVYGRTLSASEIKSIYTAGSAGKFDAASSFSQNLAEANVTLAGVTTNVIFGNNTTWQTNTITFLATTNATTFSLTGLQPGVLLDSFSLATAVTNVTTNIVVTADNLYYLPEDSLEPLIGTSAYGEWTLEILDNRAGMTNNAQLVSWQLNLTFANTNFSTSINTNPFTGPVTNFIPGGALQWYLINVPTNADIATNSLLFATLPLHMWWSTNAPPTVTNAADVQLLNNSTAGTAVLYTNPAPAFIVPGGSYYLGIQNTNTAGATYAIDVTFHIAFGVPTIITLPASNITSNSATLNALVNPNNFASDVYFEYGATTNYGLFSATNSLTTNLGLQQGVSIDITNLTPGAVYHFRAVGTNIFGVAYGADLTFTNPYITPAPYATTLPGTMLTGSSAQLNGFATANGEPAIAWFEFGTSTGYGLKTPPVNVGSNYNVVFVTNQLSGLITNQPYHYRLVISNLVGVTYGFDQQFDQANVVAWGADYIGQATVPPGLTNLFVSIGAGYEHSLAVNNDGTVVAWGNDTFGQTNIPAGLNNAVYANGGERDSLALLSDRTVLVWGSNQFRQTNTPPGLVNAVAAASGGYHCIALGDDGKVVCWGFNGSGQTNVPAGLTNVVAVSAGEMHSVALKNDGTVVAWGYNADGETDVPPGLTNVVAISAGGYHTLALKNDGTVVAWGYNASGQTNVPGSLANVVAVAGGGYHSLALRRNGTVVGWGDNSANQLLQPPGMSNVVAIAGGGLHSLALSAQFGLNQTNTPPFWTNGLNGSTVTMNEMTTLLVTNRALDANRPPQTLLYSFISAPPWAAIDSFTGIITLTPAETNGPSTNVIITLVTDNGFPTASATNSFTVIVNEVNRPPVLTLPPDTNIVSLAPFTAPAAATDPDVPTNALTFALVSGPAGLTVSTNGIINWTPTIFQAGTNLVFVSVTDTNPWALVNRSLSVTNSFAIVVTNPPGTVTNINIASIVYTNIGGSNGFLLTWFAPSNFLFQVQWTDTLSPMNWQTFTNPSPVTYNTNFPASSASATFTFFDDGSQAPFTGTRFYRLLLLTNAPNVAPVFTLGSPLTRFVSPTATLTVTNAATDANAGQTLTYALISPSVGVNIDTNTGVITWTNVPLALAGTTNNAITTVVTDNGTPPLSATNIINVSVNPLPLFGATIFGTNGTTLQWTGWTNEQFQVQWATNLATPVTWTLYPNNISPLTITSTNGTFTFVDTNAMLLMKFYQLILLP